MGAAICPSTTDMRSPTMFSRRRFLSLMAATAAAAGMHRGIAGAVPRPVRLGILAPSHCALPVVLAGARGLFGSQGLDAEVRYFPEMEEIAAALVADGLDFGQLAVPMAVGMNQGAAGAPAQTPLTIVQVLGINGGALSVGTATPIRKLAELHGKRIGIHSPWIIHRTIFLRMMDQYGMRPGRDFELVQVPLSGLGAALEEGRIEGIIGPEPGPSLLAAKGVARPLLYTKTFWTDHPCCVLATRRDHFERDPDLVADVTRAVMVAGLTLDSIVLRNEAIGEAHRSSPAYERLPLDLLLQAFGPTRSDFYPFPFHSSLRVVVEQMAAAGVLAADTDPGQVATAMIPAPFSLEVLLQAAQEVPNARVPDGYERDERLRIIGS